MNKIVIESDENGKLIIDSCGKKVYCESARLQLNGVDGDIIQASIKLMHHADIDFIDSCSYRINNGKDMTLNINCETQEVCYCYLGHYYTTKENNILKSDNNTENKGAGK
jgi:hypothetical protein